MTDKAHTDVVRLRCYFTGIVQGVGFRPTLARIAREEKLSGWVLNSTTGVLCEVEGEMEACLNFFERVHSEAPPISRITSSFKEILPPVGLLGFHIKESEEAEGEVTLVSPDTAICNDCAKELLDRNDRRYRYPFINCTNCGPRYSIIEALPYDRPNTTMKDFLMCEECRAEYEDSANRRYHAQPNACHVCGPQVFLTNTNGEIIAEREDALEKAVRLLADGAILAIKGIGGFHLACDAFNNSVVERLRERKRRARFKPLAIVVKDIALLSQLVKINSDEMALLASPISPIVLLEKKDTVISEKISPLVAPRTSLFGVMVPYSPLHLLLFNTPLADGEDRTLQVLVMTSGNLSEEPLAFENEEALLRLAGIADYFLMHNRRIVAPSDDSIVRFIMGVPRTLRIGRGYAPYPVALATREDEECLAQSILGFGADLKSTFCLSIGRFAVISPHLGDMENIFAQAFHRRTLEHYQKLFRQKPEVVVADKHPLYYSKKLARVFAKKNDAKFIEAQHHHSHLASAYIENHINGQVIALSFDGTGYGDDGTIWGAEVLVGDLNSFERVATIYTLNLPGGEASIHEPWRLGLSAIYSTEPSLAEDALSYLSPKNVEGGRVVLKMIRDGVGLVPSTSLGRLFDAFSAILGICNQASYEAQPAIELEMCASQADKCEPLPYRIFEKDYLLILDWRSAITRAIERLLSNGFVPFTLSDRNLSLTSHLDLPPLVRQLARAFIDMLISGFSEVASKTSEELGVNQVILSGGCFQNKLFLEGMHNKLKALGLRVIAQSGVPVNDAGVSLGQLAIGLGLKRSSTGKKLIDTNEL